MPATVAALYETASDAMLARGGAASDALRRLLKRIFFEAHTLQRRVIDDWQLDEAALGLEAPEELARIREWAVAKAGGFKRSSGLDEVTFPLRAMPASVAELRNACAALLSEATRDALAEVRRRVACDELPLLSLLQASPLRVQSSHLSFQEYFAAKALCEEGATLALGVKPWHMPAWWANALEMGAEMGEGFGRGLLRAAGVTGDELDLDAQLGGHQPTALRAVGLLPLKTVYLNSACPPTAPPRARRRLCMRA